MVFGHEVDDNISKRLHDALRGQIEVRRRMIAAFNDENNP